MVDNPTYSLVTDSKKYRQSEINCSNIIQEENYNVNQSFQSENKTNFKRRDSRDRLYEKRKESKEKKQRSNSRKDKNYSVIIEKIEQNFEPRQKTNKSYFYEENPDKDSLLEGYKPTNIKQIPPRRTTDIISYREARKQLKQRNKGSGDKDIKTDKTNVMNPQHSHHSELSINKPENNELKSKNKIPEIIATKPQKKPKKIKKNVSSQLSSSKKFYKSFMRSGNFEKQFCDEIKSPRKIKKAEAEKKTLNTSLDQNDEPEIEDSVQNKKPISNLEIEDLNQPQTSLNSISNDDASNTLNIEKKVSNNKQNNLLTSTQNKDNINIYQDSDEIKILEPGLPLFSGNNSETPRYSDLENNSRFYEYSDVTSAGIMPSKQSK